MNYYCYRKKCIIAINLQFTKLNLTHGCVRKQYHVVSHTERKVQTFELISVNDFILEVNITPEQFCPCM